jgi:hypothetical protein
MATEPRGLLKKQSRLARQPVKSGELVATGTLDGTTTIEVLTLSVVAEKLSLQMQGTLTGTIEFSIDGKTFINSTAIPAAGVITNFSTHLVASVKVTRATGSGTLTVAAR